MNARDALTAAAVVLAWGMTFVPMKFALQQAPPMTLGLLRFAFMLLLALPLTTRPAVPWRYWPLMA